MMPDAGLVALMAVTDLDTGAAQVPAQSSPTPQEDWRSVMVCDGTFCYVDWEPVDDTPAPRPSNGNGWINDDESRTRFWVWTEKLGLTHAQVHEACGVASMNDYAGSKSEAVAAINAYIETHSAQAQEA